MNLNQTSEVKYLSFKFQYVFKITYISSIITKNSLQFTYALCMKIYHGFTTSKQQNFNMPCILQLNKCECTSTYGTSMCKDGGDNQGVLKFDKDNASNIGECINHA